MNENAQPTLSKRAQDFVVRAEGDEAEREPASQGVKAALDVRNRFDSDSKQVGLRDSTWLLVGAGTIAAVVLTWGSSSGIDLFARLLVIGGGVTILAAVASRWFLDR